QRFECLTFEDNVAIFPLAKSLQKAPIPSKIKVFGWLKALDRLNTHDVLQTRKDNL
ncbi:hypothetical protein PanWU01x14_313950, partial [Parasponia andersonii]